MSCYTSCNFRTSPPTGTGLHIKSRNTTGETRGSVGPKRHSCRWGNSLGERCCPFARSQRRVILCEGNTTVALNCRGDSACMGERKREQTLAVRICARLVLVATALNSRSRSSACQNLHFMLTVTVYSNKDKISALAVAIYSKSQLAKHHLCVHPNQQWEEINKTKCEFCQ